MPHLLDLPTEVILNILSNCAQDTDARHRLSSQSPGRQAILSLALSCRRAFSLAEPWLYQTITLRRGIANNAPFRDFKQRLLDDPRRDGHVKDVALVPASGGVDPDMLSWGSFVAGLPNVEHLFIELPFAQPDAIHDEETGDYVSPFWSNFRKTFTTQHIGAIPQTRVPGWANSLTTCHLNFNAPSGYCAPLGDIANVIAAPQLLRLSIVAADLSEFEFDHKTTRLRSSPLQHLRLENCVVPESALRHILSIPRGLVSFFEHGGLSTNDDTTAAERLYGLVHALTQHRSTLTTLNINPREVRLVPDFEATTSKTIPLASLASLTHLTIDLRDWRFEVGPTPLLERLPIQLKHLHVKADLTHHSASIPAYFAYWANRIRRRTNRYRPANSTFPQLKSFAAEMMHIAPSAINASQRDDLETAAWRLKRESKVRMLIYRRTKQRHAIPPYLWNEYEPELVTMLDSDVMEKENLWNTQTPSEIEELKRQEQQWHINRMIELDQQRLERRRQRMIKQVEKWEQDEMPCEADLEAAVLAAKKEKERKMREAMDEWKGFPLVPPENGDGWDWEKTTARPGGPSTLNEPTPTSDAEPNTPSDEQEAATQMVAKTEPESTSGEPHDQSQMTADPETAKTDPTKEATHTDDSSLATAAFKNNGSGSTETPKDHENTTSQAASSQQPDPAVPPPIKTSKASAEEGSSNLSPSEAPAPVPVATTPTTLGPASTESIETELPAGKGKAPEAADLEQKQRDNKDASKAAAKGKDAAAATLLAAETVAEEADVAVAAAAAAAVADPEPSPSQGQPLSVSVPALNSAAEPVAVG